MKAEKRLESVRSSLLTNMESYYVGLVTFSTSLVISDENVANIKFLLKENFELWKKCLDPKNVIDNQELGKWEINFNQAMGI